MGIAARVRIGTGGGTGVDGANALQALISMLMSQQRAAMPAGPAASDNGTGWRCVAGEWRIEAGEASIPLGRRLPAASGQLTANRADASIDARPMRSVSPA